MQKSLSRIFAVIPAAGVGSRMAAGVAKQYLMLEGRTVLERAVAALVADQRVEGVLVVTAAGDLQANGLSLDRQFGPKVRIVACGGASRAESVRNGIEHWAAAGAGAADWVVVHDAARPCLSTAELRRLIDTLEDDAIGGLLAVPLADTLKRADEMHRVEATVVRERLWRAATPQMFRLGVLRQALGVPGALERATDEAAAVEALGHRPRLVEGSPSNIKITTAGDLALARAIIATQSEVK